MLRWLLVVGLYAVLFGAGWIVGTFYPAPPSIAGPIAANAPGIAARLGVDEVTMTRLSEVLSAEEFAQLRTEAVALAAEAGDAIAVERDEENLRAMFASVEGSVIAPDAPPVTASTPQATPSAPAAVFETTLALCPRMTVSNAPPADAERRARNYAPVVSVNGVAIAVNPTRGACLSSAFGPRGSGQHRGLDYHAATGGPIYAAGDGVVVERKYRDDYGNMLLIDHGGGVFTRYAHLSSFDDATLVGARVTAGQQIGLMGNTAAYPIPIHLHYELLLGDYNTPRQSFGLEARSPFTFPAP
jgi:murein DD-endopeptidase MepM/ murein hydrolase activator NlpD